MKRFRKTLLAAGFVALAVTTSAALAGSGVGGVFNLGQTNTVDGSSALSGTTAGSQLSVANASTAGTGVGIAGQSASATGAAIVGTNTAGGPALQAVVSSNSVPPLKVNSTALVTDLNANLLGGHGPASFYRMRVGPAKNTLTTLDSTGDVGQYISTTVGTDALPLVSYYDVTNGNLKVAHCSFQTCTSATSTTLDSTGDVGKFSSIAVGGDGLGLISYYDAANGHLKVAHCSNIKCTSATTTTVDNGTAVGKETSLTVGSDGFGLISYEGASNGELKIAHCTNAACTSSSTATIVTVIPGNPLVDMYSAITTGADGLGLVTYSTYSGALEVAHCANVACSSITTPSLVDHGGNFDLVGSITIGADGLGLISYTDQDTLTLVVAHCANPQCSAITSGDFGQGLNAANSAVGNPSVTIGADGLALISYYFDGSLKVAHCIDLACSDASFAPLLDQTADVGSYNAVTIGADGLPFIAYYDSTNGNLKVAHCANEFCVPYFRRR